MSDPFTESAPDLNGSTPAELASAASTAVESVGFGDGPFRLDPIPRVIGADDWTSLAAGLTQRVRALDAWCADVYGERRIVRDGVVPARVIDTIDTLEPDLVGVSLPRWIGIAGLDVVRAPDGRFLVLEDNVRTPSGMAYAIAARTVTESLLGTAEVVSLDELRGMLESVLGEGRAVVLTDGVDNSAYWEHRWLADLLDIPLLEPAQLDLEAVDVIYRRTTTPRSTRRSDACWRSRGGRAGYGSSTPSAPASPTTSSRTRTSRTWCATTSARSRPCRRSARSTSAGLRRSTRRSTGSTSW